MTTRRRKVKVPLYGAVNRAAMIEDGATFGATFDSTLFYADGSIVTLENLADALGLGDTNIDTSLPLARTLWTLIQEIPSNIVQLAALSTAGMIVRLGDGRIITRDEPNVGFAFTIEQQGEDGDMGFPGLPGAVGAQGAPGPALFALADDPQDGDPGAPGRDGAPGAAGATGTEGPAGPAIFFLANDAEDADPGPPGQHGVDGATGSQGPSGPAVFFLAESGDEGDPGPPGRPGDDGAAGAAGAAGAQGVPGPPGEDAEESFDFTFALSGVAFLNAPAQRWGAPQVFAAPVTAGGTRPASVVFEANSVAAPGRTGRVSFYAPGDDADAKTWSIVHGFNAWQLQIQSDDGSAFRSALTITAGPLTVGGLMISELIFGNTTDRPQSTFRGRVHTYGPLTGEAAVMAGVALMYADMNEDGDRGPPGPTGPAGGGGGGGSLTVGTATLNFGAFPGASDASVSVTGQAGIVAGSVVHAWLVAADSADHTADEHLLETIEVRAGNIVAGTGFTIYARNASQVNEPLEGGGVGRAETAVVGAQPEHNNKWVGGQGTRIYGQWNVRWMWQTP